MNLKNIKTINKLKLKVTLNFLLLLGFLNCSLNVNLFAQNNEKWVLEIGGKVIDDSNGQEMAEVLIVLLKDKTEINKVRTTASGAFLFKVPQDDEYTLVFSKNG